MITNLNVLHLVTSGYHNTCTLVTILYPRSV